MIRTRLAFFAEGVAIDRETNNISAYSVVDVLQAASFPLAIFGYVFHISLQRDPGDPDVIPIELIIKNNEILMLRQVFPIPFENTPRGRLNVKFANLVIPAPGVLGFTALLSGQMIASYSVDVLQSSLFLGVG